MLKNFKWRAKSEDANYTTLIWLPPYVTFCLWKQLDDRIRIQLILYFIWIEHERVILILSPFLIFISQIKKTCRNQGTTLNIVLIYHLSRHYYRITLYYVSRSTSVENVKMDHDQCSTVLPALILKDSRIKKNFNY